MTSFYGKFTALLLCVSLNFINGQTASLPTLPEWPAKPAQDWLLDGSGYRAQVCQGQKPNQLSLSNGLIQRTFLLAPNAATIGFDNLMTGENLLRGVKPEAILVVDSMQFNVGGLVGQENYAFLREGDLSDLRPDSNSLRFAGLSVSEPRAPFAWKRVRHHAPGVKWPAPGIHLQLDFVAAGRTGQPAIKVNVHYELYDGIPVMAKWLDVTNTGSESVTIDNFVSEVLAAVEYGSAVETRHYGIRPPNIHVETDYAFASFNVDDANHHVVRWEPDPDYSSQVNYLRLTPCLLKVSPEIGPAKKLEPDSTFTSFRTFLLPHDSYDRERQGLALRRMYRTLAPWTTENPLMMHARFADWPQVKKAIDQCAEVGFEMVILTFGSGFNIEDDSEEYLAKMKSYADYARSRGIEIGGYSPVGKPQYWSGGGCGPARRAKTDLRQFALSQQRLGGGLLPKVVRLLRTIGVYPAGTRWILPRRPLYVARASRT